MPEYKLEPTNQNISTDYNGFLSLVGFYNYASKYSNCWVSLNFDGVNFIDANLCALLYSMIFQLRSLKNVKTFIDYSSLKRDLNVLNRNGFITHVLNKQFLFKPYDNRDTTIPLLTMSAKDADGFCNYIESDFLHQRGLSGVALIDKTIIANSYLEIFSNVDLHANTTSPIFVCGQYFPKQGEVKFTLVDLGDGFLKKISEFTQGKENITKAADAINWAINGGSTKKDARGGTGLRNIYKYCLRSGGAMHIASNNCYYSVVNKSVTSFTIPNPFIGTTIHLIFRFINN